MLVTLLLLLLLLLLSITPFGTKNLTDGNVVEAVDSFVFVGSLQSYDECRIDRHETPYWTLLMFLPNIIYTYQLLIQPILLVYAAEIWTLDSSDMNCRCISYEMFVADRQCLMTPTHL